MRINYLFLAELIFATLCSIILIPKLWNTFNDNKLYFRPDVAIASAQYVTFYWIIAILIAKIIFIDIKLSKLFEKVLEGNIAASITIFSFVFVVCSICMALLLFFTINAGR